MGIGVVGHIRSTTTVGESDNMQVFSVWRETYFFKEGQLTRDELFDQAQQNKESAIRTPYFVV